MRFYIRATGNNRYAGGTKNWLRIRTIKNGTAYVGPKDCNLGINISTDSDNLEFRMGQWPNTVPCSRLRVVLEIAKQPHYKASWCGWKDSIFLGTDINPVTNMIYDYWIIKSGDSTVSYAAQHGDKDSDYGSAPIGMLDERDMMPNILKHSDEDYIFGIVRAKYFALLYLALDTKPLIYNVYSNL